tara:strand:- start:1166 stop:2326 length:1161 start_codon:yes stop_codon:yes gene_type:complete
MIEKDKIWQWWPLFPLYPYGSKKTVIKELIPNQIWSLEQIQGIYYVAVPVRMTVIKVSQGLILINPLPPTLELLNQLNKLILLYGPIKTIILPTASGLEHKIGLPSLARVFNNSEIWLCPGQWSFPINLPLDFIGIPSKRTKILFEDGLPYEDLFEWITLGPINLGLGRFQEISCFHKPTGTLHVTDAIIGIESNPPEIFDHDPTPLLFHGRDRGDELLVDSPEVRKKGWARLVLFASYLRPSKLNIPSLNHIIKYSFKKGLRNKRAHFGIYPFLWDKDWKESISEIIGDSSPKIQIAPVLQRLIFPRSKELLSKWLEVVEKIEGMKYLISAHYSSPVSFSKKDCQELIKIVNSDKWNELNDDNKFLSSFYEKLYKIGIIPENINL